MVPRETPHPNPWSALRGPSPQGEREYYRGPRGGWETEAACTTVRARFGETVYVRSGARHAVVFRHRRCRPGAGRRGDARASGGDAGAWRPGWRSRRLQALDEPAVGADAADLFRP